MIKGLLKLGLILVVGILFYNRFFGTDVEKEQAKQVFSSVKGVVKSVGNIMASEKDKFDAGKYDGVMDKLGNAYTSIRERAQYVDQNVLQKLDELEKRKKALENDLDGMKIEDETKESSEAKPTLAKDKKKQEAINSSKEADRKAREAKLRKEMEQLLKETETLLDDAEKSK